MASAAMVSTGEVQVMSVVQGSVNVASCTYFNTAMGASAHETFSKALQGDLSTIFSAAVWGSYGDIAVVTVAELVYEDEYEELEGVDDGAPPDLEPPIITLLGSPYVELLQRHSFEDPGASAQDAVDGFGVTVTVHGADEVDACCLTDPAVPFLVTYEAADRAGNRAAPVVRQVAVVPACAPPSFLCEELVGVVCAVCDTPATGQSQAHAEPTCICLDSNLDAEQEAVVKPYEPPRDTTLPVLTLNGEGVLGVTASGTVIMMHEVLLGQTFTEPGVQAHDDVDGDLAAAIGSFGMGAIDTSRATSPDAPYVVRYTVTDAAGNAAAEVRRRVTVVDPCASQGERLCAYVEGSPECSTADLCLSTSSALAASGEDASATAPPAPPALELIGPGELEVAEGAGAYAACPEQYDRSLVCDRGAAAHDALDGDLSARVLACSPDGVTQRFSSKGVAGCAIDTSAPGVYTVEFSVENSAGLTARAFRNVTVVPACPVGESLCPSGLQCSFNGVCMDGLDSPEPEAPVDHPPTVTLAMTAQVASAFVEVKQHARYAACREEDEGSGAPTLCEPGAVANDTEDGDLSAAVLSCPPISCRHLGCPGHEWAAKGIEGCLNTSAEVGTMFQVEFLVFDNAVPSQAASVHRTVTIIAPCESQEILCEDLSCSSVDCHLRDSLLTEPTGDVAPPVITFRGPSKVVVGYGDAAGAAGLAPCSSQSTEGCYVVAEDVGAAGNATLDVSSTLEVQQDVNCGECGATSSCMFARLAQCFPGSYAYLFSATDAAGNRGVARLWVSVEEQAAITGVIQVAANTANVTEAYARADTLAQRGSVANTAVRQGIVSAASLGQSASQQVRLEGTSVTGVAVHDTDDWPVLRGSEASAAAEGLTLMVSFALNVTSSGGGNGASQRRRLRQNDAAAHAAGSSSGDDVAAAITTSASNGDLSIFISAAAEGLDGAHSAAVEVTKADDMTATDLTPKVDVTAAYATKIASEVENMQRAGDAMAEELALALTRTSEATASYTSTEPIERVLTPWIEQQQGDLSNIEELGQTADEMLASFIKLQAAFELVQEGMAEAQTALHNSYEAMETTLQESGQFSARTGIGPDAQQWAPPEDVPDCHYPVSPDEVRATRVYSFLAAAPGASRRRHLLGRRKGGEGTESYVITAASEAALQQETAVIKYPRYGPWKMPIKDTPDMFRGPRESDRGRHLTGGGKNLLVSGLFFYVHKGNEGQQCSARFAHLEAPCLRGRWEGRYGSDPVFRPGSSLFDSTLLGKEGDYYNTSGALRVTGVPMPFAPRAAPGFSGGQPFHFDTRMHAYRAWESYVFVDEGRAVQEASTKAVDVRMMLWNSQQQVWSSARLNWYRTLGGALKIEVDVQLAPVQYWGRSDTTSVLILVAHIAWAAVSLWVFLQTAGSLRPSRLSKLHPTAENYPAQLAQHLANPEHLWAAVGAASQMIVVLWFLIYQLKMHGGFFPSGVFDIVYDINADANYFMSDRAPMDGEVSGAGDADGLAAGATDTAQPAWARPEDNSGLEGYLRQEAEVYTLAIFGRVFFFGQALRSLIMMSRMMWMVGQQSRLGVLTKTIRGSFLELLQACVFILILMMWSLLMNIEVGPRNEKFSTLSDSMISLSQVGLLGDWLILQNDSWVDTARSLVYMLIYAFFYQLVVSNFILAILCDELMKHLSESRSSLTMVQDLTKFHRNRLNVVVRKKWRPMEQVVDMLTRGIYGGSTWELRSGMRAPRITITTILARHQALPTLHEEDPSTRVAGKRLNSRVLGMLLHQEYRRIKRKPRELQRSAMTMQTKEQIMVRTSLGLPPKSPATARMAFPSADEPEDFSTKLLNMTMAGKQFNIAADNIVRNASHLDEGFDKRQNKPSGKRRSTSPQSRGQRKLIRATLHGAELEERLYNYMRCLHQERHSLQEATRRVEAVLFAYACKMEAEAAQSGIPASPQVTISARPPAGGTLVQSEVALSTQSRSQPTTSPELQGNSNPHTPPDLQAPDITVMRSPMFE
ncbi:hypothetical protein CYMTET_56024 [Cymbomonas tetramitiformis]|uniref:Pesticidal crystal protein Cry22Aa Ig-like domain-containing protein n=1 Tax=Cymbomonas tetramitiformis TaxID=36881 RepID=A0AAE0BC54_9CHLO|nr:hypothetical protein CYMTET_56024 [Cymbomonas tetramitiformis]